MPTLTERDLSVEALAKKTYLNLDQRNELERSIESTTTMLNETRAGRVDGEIEAMEKQLSRERAMLASGSPPDLDTVSKNRLYLKVKELEERFTAPLPTYEQMQIASPNHVDWHTAWERQHQQDVLAWKTGLMMLDPNNTEPNFRNIARLRGNKAQGNDPRKYWQGFEAIKFQEKEQEILDNLIKTMDDESYMLFLQLKAADWPKPLILRQLEWSDDMYAAAESRYEKALQKLTGNGHAIAMPEVVEMPEEEEETTEEAEETTEKPSPVKAWPMPFLKAHKLPVSKFCRMAKINMQMFYRARANGIWPKAMKAAIEKALEKLQDEAKQAHAEAVSTIVAEPIEV